MLRVACVQMEGGADRARNLEAAGRLVARAAENGAELVVLPERWECIGGARDLLAAAARFDERMEMRDWARGYGVWLVGGSVSEPADSERLSNTTLVFSLDGDEVARYAKLHLFDVEVPRGQVYRESATDDAGTEVVAFAGPGGVVVGLTICASPSSFAHSGIAAPSLSCARRASPP